MSLKNAHVEVVVYSCAHDFIEVLLSIIMVSICHFAIPWRIPYGSVKVLAVLSSDHVGIFENSSNGP